MTPFDALRYQRLMDGLEAVKISFGRLERSLRFDPEFYKKGHLEVEAALKKKGSSRLGSICSLFDGPFGSELLADAYTQEGIPILRMQNISKDGSLKLDDVLFVSENDSDYLKKYEAFPGEVVSTKIGFLGHSTVLTSSYEKYIFRRELTRFKINRDINLNPYYLATFLIQDLGAVNFIDMQVVQREIECYLLVKEKFQLLYLIMLSKTISKTLLNTLTKKAEVGRHLSTS